jgi:hypothetical protein
MPPNEVAVWMLEELERVKFLYQETAVYDIATKFGQQFTYINANGNMAIRKGVLDAFAKLTGDAVVFERTERMWRKRQPYDRPGRQQD